MNQEIEKLKKEQEDLVKESQVLDERKNKIITRLVEIQGILKFINNKEKEK